VIVRLATALAVANVIAACTTGAQQRVPPPGQADTANFRAVIAKIARESNGDLGVGVELLETGERLVVGNHHHPMQSVYKLPIAMAVLERVDRGTLRLDQQVDVPTSMFVTPGQYSPIRDGFPTGTRLTLRELLRYNTAESDGTACDVLLGLIGGPAVATQYLRRIGVQDMVAATTERVMGEDHRAQYRNWSTPEAGLTLLRTFHQGRVLSDTSRALLLRFLTEGTRGAGRNRGDLPPGTVVAHKPGSSGTENGVAAATNDIGIVTLPDGRHLAIAVFLTDARADAPARDRTIARVARAAWETWVATTVRPSARPSH